MTYLYGDSSPSALESNFIDFLRLALDFGVHVVLADQRILVGRERRQARERAAAAELERLEALGETVQRVMKASGDSAESPTGRCAVTISKAATEAVRNEVAAVKGALASALAGIDADAARERESCVSALEKLLMKHDLPGTESSMHLAGEGGSYAARLRGKTGFGLVTVIQLDIPSANLFAHDVRIDKLMEVEIHAPETGGWIRKETRMVVHKLGKLHLTELTLDGDATSFKLRTQGDAHPTGFDVSIRDEAPRVSVSRVGKDEASGGRFDAEPADQAKLLALYEKLAPPLGELMESRKALVQAALDGQLMREYERPIVLMERLVGVMAPIVREIAAHSLSPNELVLRRMLSADHREEIFVPKAELVQKILALPEEERGLFDALGLADANPMRAGWRAPPPSPALPSGKPVTSGAVPATAGTIAPVPPAPVEVPIAVGVPVNEEEWLPIDEDSAPTTVGSRPK